MTIRMPDDRKLIHFRVTELEKQAFLQSAEIAGISMTAWIRESLRHSAIRELLNAGRKVPFIPPINL